MRITTDDDFTPEWRDDGTTIRAGRITCTEDDQATTRLILALVEDEGQTDVHLVYGPTDAAGLDSRSSVVLRGALGIGFLRLAVRALRAYERQRKEDDE